MAISKGASVSFSGETLNTYLPEAARGLLGVRLRPDVVIDGDVARVQFWRARPGERGIRLIETANNTMPFRVTAQGERMLKLTKDLAPFKLLWTEEFEIAVNGSDAYPVIRVDLPRGEMKNSPGPRRVLRGRVSTEPVQERASGAPDPHVELGRCLRQLNAILASGKVDDVTIVVDHGGTAPAAYDHPSTLKITGRRAVTLGE